jgi:hypothetical protein
MTVAEPEELAPALFDHAKRVYEEMQKSAKTEHYYGEEMGWQSHRGEAVTVEHPGPYESRVVYEGHLTRLFSDLNIANPYYTKIRAALVAQGCIEQIRRGGGVATSKWVLCHPPEEDGFKAIMERRRAPKGRGAIIDQRVSDLMKLVAQHEEAIENLSNSILKLMRDIETIQKREGGAPL